MSNIILFLRYRDVLLGTLVEKDDLMKLKTYTLNHIEYLHSLDYDKIMNEKIHWGLWLFWYFIMKIIKYINYLLKLIKYIKNDRSSTLALIVSKPLS